MEVKSFDMTTAGAALVAVGAVSGTEPAAAYTGLTEVNCIPQGATVANRIGNKVVIKSIHLNVTISCTALANANVSRCMLVYDRQPNAAFPAIGDIILSQPAGTTSDFSGINMANKSRFQMIRDQTVVVGGSGPFAECLNWYCKGRWEVEYGGTAGTIADFRTGAIYFIAFSTLTITGGATQTDLHCRVRYYD